MMASPALRFEIRKCLKLTQMTLYYDKHNGGDMVDNRSDNAGC